MAGSNHFDFAPNTGQSYQADLVDDLLDMEALPDLTPEFPVNLMGGDLQANAPVREPTSEEVAYDVEDAFLDLLSQDRRQDILALTGELPDDIGAIDDDTQEEFSSKYNQAIQSNPGLKWYAKFTKLLGPENFCMESEQLNLRIPSAIFAKVVQPFMTDFKEEWVDESPIVKCVRLIAQKLDSDYHTAKLAQHAASLKQSKNIEHNQFDVAEIDFSPTDAQARVDIEDDIFGGDEEDRTGSVTDATIKVSLQDFSNKAIAEQVDAEGLDGEGITSRLLDEGFSKARTNEISAIVRYMRTDRATRKSGYTGSRGGDIEFTLWR